jgi:hypothetical protein
MHLLEIDAFPILAIHADAHQDQIDIEKLIAMAHSATPGA